MKKGLLFIVISAGMVMYSACEGSAKSPAAGTPDRSPTVVLPSPFAAITADTFSPKSAGKTTSPAATETLFSNSGAVYQVNLTSSDFVDTVDNPYFPLPPGAKWEYEIHEGNGARQTDTLEVMKETRDVNGVKATVVRDTVSAGDQIVEDTYDWFAQDKYGNVWYVGESVDNYVGGVIASHAGSWEWGVDGAQPGIIMWADPSVHEGEEYRQEYYPGRAEDLGKVLTVGESLTVPFGSFDHVLKTLDTSALETNAREQKFYAPGIGLLKELDLNTNEEMVLIKFTQPAR